MRLILSRMNETPGEPPGSYEDLFRVLLRSAGKPTPERTRQVVSLKLGCQVTGVSNPSQEGSTQ